jgi:hypothetical protein
MNLTELAKIIARATRTNASAMESIRTEYAAIALQIATSEAAGKEVTSATVNGQSFTSAVTMSKMDRLYLLEKVIWFYDNGIVSTTRTRVYFS